MEAACETSQQIQLGYKVVVKVVSSFFCKIFIFSSMFPGFFQSRRCVFSYFWYIQVCFLSYGDSRIVILLG